MSIIENLIKHNRDGTISLTECYSAAGLGGNPYRDELNFCLFEISGSEAQKVCIELYDLNSKKIAAITDRTFQA